MDLAQQIKSRILLSSVVKEVVRLRGRAPNYVGLCPFHAEKTPSFYVRDALGRYKCFGCGESGDIFQFLIRLKGLSFNEVKKQLADKAGLRLLENTPISSKSTGILHAQAVAHKYFIRALNDKEGGPALNYLRNERGLSDVMIKQAQIGFGGVNNELIRNLHQAEISNQSAVDAGVLKSHNDSLENNFKDRIIFPIRDMSGKVVAFGGRALPNSLGPKYINSHSNEFFIKRNNFYGLFESRNAINQGRPPVVVEGYFDALAFWAIGMPALALCGTSLSKGHVDALSRMSSSIYLCFDDDQAGFLALRNALLELAKKDLMGKVISLTLKDPGDYLIGQRLNELKTAVSLATDGIVFLIDRTANISSFDIGEKMRRIDDLLPVFANINRPLLRRQYVYYLAQTMHEDSQILWAEVERKISLKTNKDHSLKRSSKPNLFMEYKLLFEIVLGDPDLFDEVINLLPESSGTLKSILKILVDRILSNGVMDKLDVEIALVNELPDNILVIKSLLQDIILLTKDEAKQTLLDLKAKADNKALKSYIGKKRIEIAEYDRKKDYESAIATLKEQHSLISKSHKKEKAKNLSSQVPSKNELKKHKKIERIDDAPIIFNPAEDWF